MVSFLYSDVEGFVSIFAHKLVELLFDEIHYKLIINQPIFNPI